MCGRTTSLITVWIQPKVPIFNHHNVSIQFKNLKKSSTGPDGLSPVLLKYARFDLCDILVELANCVNLTYEPDQWKFANVTPIPKVSISVTETNFRSISNLSALDKVFQRVIVGYIIRISSQFRLNNKQFGFLPGRSTMDAITELIEGWSHAWDSKS